MSVTMRTIIASRLMIVRSPPKNGSFNGSFSGQESNIASTSVILTLAKIRFFWARCHAWDGEDEEADRKKKQVGAPHRHVLANPLDAHAAHGGHPTVQTPVEHDQAEYAQHRHNLEIE